MADYIIIDGQDEVPDEEKSLDKIETTEIRTRVSVAQLKRRRDDVEAEILRLAAESDAIIAETQDIVDSGIVTVAELPGPISISVATPTPVVIKLKEG